MLWDSIHGLGACTFIILVPTAIIINDIAEEKVAWISGGLFLLFTSTIYLTGEYFPVIKVKNCRTCYAIMIIITIIYVICV